MEAPTAQIRLKNNVIVAEGAGPSIIWVTPSRARFLIDAGAADLFGRMPTEQPSAGPSETKPQEPQEKKSSAIARDGQLIDSASSMPAQDAPASPASAAAPALPTRKLAASKKRKKAKRSKSSR
jgi:hypothetical protein